MATDAKETAKQENGSRVYFEHVIEKGREPSDQMMLGVYDGYGPEWKETYRKQTQALKKYLGSSKGYEYSRDSGIMPFLENVAKVYCGVSVKDRWNPMDIVLVKKTKRQVIEGTVKEILTIDGMSKESRLSLLNSYMRELLREKVLVGVSLKAIAKTKKTATSEVANAGGKSVPTEVDVVKGSIKCTLTLGRKKPFLFDTGELGFDMETAKGGKIHGQSRNFQYSKERNLVQTDLTPKGKDAGAKLGKVSSVALDSFLNGMGLERPTSAAKHKHIPPVGKWSEQDKKYWVDLYKKLDSSGMVDFGEVAVYENNKKVGDGIEDVIDYAIMYEMKKADRSSAGRFSSKLIAMEWANIWVSISKKGKSKEWCTALYYGAKKEFGDSNGPFLKIY
ncbi:MAG: hypothetical protein CMM64_00125 [Rhodospirillaceae bacterium]|nr:hypothetical protein [Rhodospirillaceae bacterium]|tara:strand:+ start:1663 stop:2835 length:1173 start_codon:yes stop_codon:yes gene_type:complete